MKLYLATLAAKKIRYITKTDRESLQKCFKNCNFIRDEIFFSAKCLVDNQRKLEFVFEIFLLLLFYDKPDSDPKIPSLPSLVSFGMLFR